MFNYILVFSTGYILLISICPRLKAGKMQSIASSAILANLLKKYFKDKKKWLVSAQQYEDFIDCFVLEVSIVGTVSRF